MLSLPFLLLFVVGGCFLLAERLWPGRELPNSSGWWWRALFLNGVQLSMVFIAGALWNRWFQQWSWLHLQSVLTPVLEGLLYWFVGTFVFYWWHRLRHAHGWWLAFHQIHHSPTRIEALTAFYKHPLEMATNSLLISALIFLIFGGSMASVAWYNLFAVAGELFYHANIRTPIWMGWVLQRPEQHSIHHQRGVHAYNFGDLTWWDRLFGTFKEAPAFTSACGFAHHAEAYLGSMLAFQDVQEPKT